MLNSDNSNGDQFTVTDLFIGDDMSVLCLCVRVFLYVYVPFCFGVCMVDHRCMCVYVCVRVFVYINFLHLCLRLYGHLQ